MTESWDVEPTDDPSAPFFFRNASQTVVTVSRRVRFDFSYLLVRMEHVGLPTAYLDKVREVRLTMLPRDYGRYQAGRIVLDAFGWGPGPLETVCQTFIHELGHHIDWEEAISDDPAVVKEKRTRYRFLPDPAGARKNVGEYVAVGFEVFYMGSAADKKRMREKNPKLWDRIRKAHRKYRRH